MEGLLKGNGKENGNYCLGFHLWDLGFRVWSSGGVVTG